MIERDQLTQYLNQLLEPELFNDYCPNGLQVSGKSKIETIISGVSANQALIEKAIEANADAVLVHHGFFWKGENPCLVGIKGQRIAQLIKHDINLYAYHLPLDAHPKYGNNQQLAELLEFKVDGQIAIDRSPPLIFTGHLRKPMSGDALANWLNTQLNRPALHIPGRVTEISRVAWCTGAAQDFIEQAYEHNVDAFITGEVSERTVSYAREAGIHFYAAGHHATERYGIQAVCQHVAKKFKLAHAFVDIDNPV